MSKNEKNSAEQALNASRAMIDQTLTQGKEQAEKFTKATHKSMEDASAYQAAAINAVIESQQILAKGMEEISRQFLNYAQKSFMVNAEALKAVAEAKSPTDLMNVNKNIYQEKIESLIKEGAVIGEDFVKLATDSNKPLQKFWNNKG